MIIKMDLSPHLVNNLYYILVQIKCPKTSRNNWNYITLIKCRISTKISIVWNIPCKCRVFYKQKVITTFFYIHITNSNLSNNILSYVLLYFPYISALNWSNGYDYYWPGTHRYREDK